MLSAVRLPLLYLGDVLLDKVALDSPLLLILVHHAEKSAGWIIIIVIGVVSFSGRSRLGILIVFSKLDIDHYLDSLQAFESNEHIRREELCVFILSIRKHITLRFGTFWIIFEVNSETSGLIQLTKFVQFTGWLIRFEAPINVEITICHVLY